MLEKNGGEGRCDHAKHKDNLDDGRSETTSASQSQDLMV